MQTIMSIELKYRGQYGYSETQYVELIGVLIRLNTRNEEKLQALSDKLDAIDTTLVESRDLQIEILAKIPIAYGSQEREAYPKEKHANTTTTTNQNTEKETTQQEEEWDKLSELSCGTRLQSDEEIDKNDD